MMKTLHSFGKHTWPRAGTLLLAAGLLLGNRTAHAQTTAYCATGLGGICGGNDITDVGLSGTTLNATGLSCAATGGQSYTSYPATGTNTGTVSGGVPYTLSVTLTGSSIVSVWVDYNHNFVYEASEWTQVATASPTGTPVSATLLVPTNAVQGTTGMRIRSRGAGNTNGATDACSNFGSGETKDFTLTIGAPAACPSVSSLAVSGITASGASVAFAPSSSATSYTVTVTPAGGTATTQTATTSPVTLTGLTPTTSYTVSIVGNCGAGQTSAANAITFQTSCAAAPYVTVNNTTPYTQDFEATWLSQCGTREAPGVNWRGLPLTGDNAWRRDDDGTSAAWSGNSGTYTPAGSPLGTGTSLHSARFHSYDASSGTRGTLDLSVNMAGTVGTPTLEFDYINTSGTDSLKVFVSTNGGTTFSAALLGLTTASTWTHRTVNLPATGLTATTIIRLRGRSDYGTTDIGVDNVRVSYISCPAVTAATATGVTATGATVSFTPASGPTSYTATITPAGGTATTQTITASPLTLTGLTASTSYTVSIVGNCGAGSTSQPTVITFSTNCVAAPYATVNNTTPYTQDFEATWLSQCGTREAPGVNWRGLPLTGDNAWRRDDDGTSAAWSGNSGTYTPAGSPLGTGTSLHSARFHTYNAADGTRGTLDLSVNMAGTVGTPTLEFDYINTSGTDSLKVFVSTNGGASFSASLLSLTTAGAWAHQTVNLPTTGLTATTIIRLRATSDYGFTDIGVDNVRVSYIACAAVSSITATGITTTGASISFNPASGPTNYTATITPAGGTATTQTITASPLTLTGLAVGTNYTVSIVSNCGAGLTSQPATFTFTTLFTAPVNDECAGAINVPIQFVTCTTATVGNNTAATASTTAPAPVNCSTGGTTGIAGYAGGDIWFKTTVPITGSVSIETSGPNGSPITDTGMAVYSGTCGTLNQVGCDDDGSASGLYSLITLTGRTPGEVLYIRVWEYNNDSFGPIGVCVTAPSNCAAPSGPTAANVTNTTATLNWQAPTGGLPAGNTYELEYGVQGFTQGTGTSVTGLTAATYALTNLQAATDYCFYVRQNCGTTNGSSAYVGPICFTTPLTAPANDEPCGAIALGTTTVTGSNVGATTSVQNGINTPACSSAALPKDVWFSFTATATTRTLTTTGIVAGMVRVYSSPDCAAGPFFLEKCQSTGTNLNAGPVNLTGLTVGTRYYVAVSGYNSSDPTGSFTILGTPTATSAQANTDALLVYPNPSNTGQLTLRLSGLSAAGQATLLNALGQVVATKTLSGTAEQTMSTRGLATGLYTLRVMVAGQVLTRKVVLE
ncbi:MAG: hypothetical protein JWP58_782 [Hymenobacter sp.]|nr:hypothetical protein [Hymenobacter sp.]